MLADKEFLESLLMYIGRRLKHEAEGLLIGGNAMIFYGLKGQTKDLDIIFYRREDITGIIQIILNHPLYKKAQVLPELPYEIKPELRKRGDPTVIGNHDLPRFDLFYKQVFSVDTDMFFERSGRSIRFDLLRLKVIEPEDLIFMKAVTSRPVDKEDIIRIVKNLKIDWKKFLQSVKSYHKQNERSVWFALGGLHDVNEEKIVPKFVLKGMAELFGLKL